MMAKKCAAPGCSVTIANSLLMCVDHWRRVPDEIQKKVYDRARDLQKADPRGGATQFRKTLDEYYSVVKEAVEAVRI